MPHIVAHQLRGRHVTAQARQRLREGAHDDIDFALKPEVAGRAAAALADNTQPVGIVHHDARAVPGGEFADLGQLRDVAAHGKDAVRDDEAARGLRHGAELGLKVVHVGMAVAEHLAEGEADFYRRLDKLMDIAARSLKTKRTVITKLLEGGLYPYTKRYLGSFENHFSTIGLVGMNEAGLNAKWLRKDLTHPQTQAFAKDVLNHMRQRLSDYQEQYGDLYNLEATPAESTAYRLAKHDKRLYPDIITANENGTPYYTNSSHLPVGYTEDIFSALDVQDELQTLYTSGTVFHAFLGEKLQDWKAAASLVRKIAENYRLPYYTLSPTYSVCKNHGYRAGEQPVCPFCGEKAEVYSRITGYYRPVQNWNDGKAQEFKDRRTYDVAASKLTHSGVPAQKADSKISPAQSCEEIRLFVTKTCPNCALAKQLLDAAGIGYTVCLAEEHRDAARALGIRQAPTLVSGGQKWAGVSGIREFLAARENANV